ncbi:MAG: AtuA-related protein, partial [Solirubrobacteraceae bacterium]
YEGRDDRAAPDRVRDLATGRAGDKGATLDLTLVARDAAAYERLERVLTAEAVERALALGPVRRYEVPGLCALKYVLPEALGTGVYSSLRAGMHWQKAAIGILLDFEC